MHFLTCPLQYHLLGEVFCSSLPSHQPSKFTGLEGSVGVAIRGHSLLLCAGSLSTGFGEGKSPVRVSEQVWSACQQEGPMVFPGGKWSTGLLHLGMSPLQPLSSPRTDTCGNDRKSQHWNFHHSGGVQCSFLSLLQDNTHTRTCMHRNIHRHETQHTQTHTHFPGLWDY